MIPKKDVSAKRRGEGCRGASAGAVTGFSYTCSFSH
jgi:hypothetical protein